MVWLAGNYYISIKDESRGFPEGCNPKVYTITNEDDLTPWVTVLFLPLIPTSQASGIFKSSDCLHSITSIK